MNYVDYWLCYAWLHTYIKWLISSQVTLSLADISFSKLILTQKESIFLNENWYTHVKMNALSRGVNRIKLRIMVKILSKSDHIGQLWGVILTPAVLRPVLSF